MATVNDPIDTQVPFLIDYIFQVSVTHSSNEHMLAFAIVQKFRMDASISGMVFPWSLWYDICGRWDCH
jgi:hypothetical protein